MSAGARLALRTGWALAALAAMVALLPSLAAQLDPGVEATVDAATVTLGPGESSRVTWTLVNTGDLEGTVEVTLSAPPAGWRATLDPGAEAFTLGPGDTRQVGTDMEILADATPANGRIQLLARLTDAAGRTATDGAAVDLRFVPPPVLPLPPPPDRSGLYAALGGGGLFTLLLGAYGAQARRVGLVPEEPRLRINAGHRRLTTVQVRNRSRRARSVRLRIRGLPPGWGGAFSASSVLLDGREARSVPLYLTLPFDEPPDRMRRIRLRARPNAWSPWWVGARLRVDVVDVPSGPAPSAAEAPPMAVLPRIVPSP